MELAEIIRRIDWRKVAFLASGIAAITAYVVQPFLLFLFLECLIIWTYYQKGEKKRRDVIIPQVKVDRASLCGHCGARFVDNKPPKCPMCGANL